MKDKLIVQIKDAVTQLYNLDVEPEVSRPDAEFGDYTTNVALQLAGRLGGNPREIAETLSQRLKGDDIKKVDVAGPGFINITLSDSALVSTFSRELSKQRQGDTVVIETNNPNPFKAMHIGHAFNSILGDTIANLLEASGAKTYRVSYHGDVGLHVGKSMYSLLKFAAGDVGKLDSVPEGERNSFMSKMYADGSKAYKENEAAKAEIDELTRQSFTREDQLYSSIYDKVFDWSFVQIDRDVARLGNKPVERKFLERDAEVRGVKIVQDNSPKVFQESDGALVFKGSDHGSFDNVFISNRGTGLYAARDLGLIQLKNEQYHPLKSYIVTAEEQRAYFIGVLAAAELCGLEAAGGTTNISTGTVKLTTGKMSSRDGEVVEIGWLFDQVAEAIKARGGEPDDQLVAGVLRYGFLRIRIGGDVIFDINEAVSLQGNSGPYLQYAHARARSILAKANSKHTEISDLQIDERSLARKIGQYTEVVDLATEELMPHHICTYLYELAQEFNRFYENNRVIGEERQELRLSLVAAYANKLRSGLGLLGIKAPERM
ncbi:MAG: arginine--tRNA ligase [bacterium]|nr:arginine--tRNA ligase [bacterium]